MNYKFVEIGTSDFDTLIQECSDEDIGLSIEPIGYYLNRLPNKKHVTKVQAAVSDKEGSIDIYYIPDEHIQNYSLPWWVRGSNSVNKPHNYSIQELGEKIYNKLVKIDKVPTITWKRLIEEYQIESIQHLKIDTEGYDHVIVNEYFKECEKNPNLLADIIQFECLPAVSNIPAIEELLTRVKGYSIERTSMDIILRKSSIPKIIHQTFRTPVPDEIQIVINRLKEMNPEYEYRFYNDEDCVKFITDNYDESILQTYLTINPIYTASRADYFRYLLMYKVGGVYLDIKSCTSKSLSEIIIPSDEYILTHWEGKDWADELNYVHGEFQNWQIICKPGHPFLKKVIDDITYNIQHYNGSIGKAAILRLTGPIAYSKSILPILDQYRQYTLTSPVREFATAEEIGLVYVGTQRHHHYIYDNAYENVEPIVIKGKHPKAFVLYATESYANTVRGCVESLNAVSNIPVYVYMLNSKIKIKGATTIEWVCNISNIPQNDFIDRKDPTIYKILIQRPEVVKDALLKYATTVAYIDADSVATSYANSIFDMYDDQNYPYFVEGIYDYLHMDGRGGAMTREDMSTTLEASACELFNVNQYVRERYRQTGYFVAGQNTIEFLDKWTEMCNHPIILKDPHQFAPYHEETILNVLLWKHNIQKGLPLVYVNCRADYLDELLTISSWGQHVKDWVRLPDSKEQLLFYHGEKDYDNMAAMNQKLNGSSKGTDTLKVLYLAPHLSTGGMPAFLLKRIEVLQEYTNVELFVVEYANYSPHFVVQKDKITNLVKNFYTLGENKYELINIIKNNKIDIVHMDETAEWFQAYNQTPEELITQLYAPDRTWKVVETCHNVTFNPEVEKRITPDGYAFCTPYHLTTFAKSSTFKTVIEFPIDSIVVTDKTKKQAKAILGFDPSKKHVLNVGLWTRGKNQGEGIYIARNNPNIQFHFVGNQAGNFQDYWEPLMKDLPTNVTVWGERHDVATFMMAADVLMFNSTLECNPLVLREAISYRLPIVARNLPQYENMFIKYIDSTPLMANLTTIKKNYKVPFDNTSKVFAEKHEAFYRKLLTKEVIPQDNVIITQHFVDNPYIEIQGNSESLFTIRVYDENNTPYYQGTVLSNHWVKFNRQYYTQWTTKIWQDNKLIYENKLDLKDRRVFITFESNSLGDNIAWMPYVEQFRLKHECHVILTTHKNFLFKKMYPEIEFVEPGTTLHNLYALYRIGWFYNNNREPEEPNTIALQKCAANILGLEYIETLPRIDFTPKRRLYDYKYITIATNSTSGCKFWTLDGWQVLSDELNKLGYRVINVSKENNPLRGVTQITDTSLENTMNVIYHSEFLIGLSSGLSWLAWAMNKHVVMISNFTESDHEFMSNCTRITNTEVCHGCWNKPAMRFDPGDWNWCPYHKGGPRQFECHTSITPEIVLEKCRMLL